MRVELHGAYVLHRRRYRETSLLLEILSSQHGKVGLVARGALGRRRATGSELQPFRPLQLSWTGRSELATLTGVEPVGQPLALEGRELFSGFYINEVVMRITARHDPNIALYEVYEGALTALANDPCGEKVLRRFEKSMLDAIGYGMNLTREPDSGDPVQPDHTYYYFLERGPSCSADGGQYVPVQGATLLALAGEHAFDKRILREAKTLMRFVLRHYIGDRPLAARTLFQESRAAAT